MTTHERNIARVRRQKRVRKKVLGTDGRPRVCVFRSKKHVYAQVISDDRGVTLVSVSTLSKGLADKVKNTRNWPKPAERKTLKGSCLIGTVFSTMAASKQWLMELEKADWNFSAAT
jgi:ribosomal protein L18